MSGYELAQLNVGKLLAPMDTPETAGFANGLDPVNALADASPGFRWRLQTEDGNATAIKTTDDPLFIVNLSVWESLEALGDFVYRSEHVTLMRRRREWFEVPVEAFLVLWWVPAGHRPSTDEALERLARLRAVGPGPDAFTFRQPFVAPDDSAAQVEADDRWECRAMTETSPPTGDDPAEVVRSFCAAWGDGDLEAVLAYFAPDAIYHNIPLDPVTGVDSIRETITGFDAGAAKIEFKVLHLVADGPMVLTERVDVFVLPETTVELPVMGTFEVHDGRITAWRDYFDLQQFMNQLAG